ncbi:MAG: hypothetical protein ABSB32_16930 [Thermodesulfobacteriota bacterium]
MRKKTKKIFFIFFSILLVVLSFKQSSAQQWSLNGLETSDYRKVVVVIENLSEDAINIGLTQERIRTKCELRLRQAGLEPLSRLNEKSECLYINIHVVGFAYHISLEFRRLIYFDAGMISYRTVSATWKIGATGTHGRDPESIIQGLDGRLDNFLNEYLKANSK